MNTQIRIAFSALALLLAAGASGSALGAQNAGTGNAAGSQSPAASMPSTAPTQGGATAGTSTATAPAQNSNNTILTMKAGEISGREIYNTQGKELGKVDMIGRDRASGEISAIVSVGGFLGFGGSKVAIPIDQLSLQDDKLILSTAMTKKELRKQASNYQSKRYEAVAEDTTLSQVAPVAGATTQPQGGTAAGTAPTPRGTPAGGNISFQELDTNHDGYISRDEAAKDPTLLNHWQQADRNHDNRIDSSEFSAFEQSSSEPRPSGDDMRQREQAQPMPQER